MYSKGLLFFFLVELQGYVSSLAAFSSKAIVFPPPPSNDRRKPPVQPTKPPGACQPTEFENLRRCYSDYLSPYQLSFQDGVLPHKSAKPFEKILNQQSVLCKNYKPFLSCEATVALHCVNFESLQKMAGDASDALYYLQNLAYIELYCDYSKQFVRYSQCLELIDANELEELVYEECELNIADNCTAVQKTVKCEKGVINMVCDDRPSMDAYCTYQNLQMKRAGWNYCIDMPCAAGNLFYIFILIYLCIYSL